jgi:hypothetical protein
MSVVQQQLLQLFQNGGRSVDQRSGLVLRRNARR